MLSALFILAPTVVGFPVPRADVPEAARSDAVSHVVRVDKVEYEKKRKAAGKDAQKLWDVYLWCDANGMGKEGRSCLRAILKEDDSHRGAHEGLNHTEYDNRWFSSKKKLEKYKKEEEVRIAKEKGLVLYKKQWVPKEHVAYLEKGLTQVPDGNWVDAEEFKKLQSGWVRQDLLWVSPEEKENIEKGLWKCDEGWKTLEEANKHHSVVEAMWVIPTNEYVLYTTCDRDVAMKAIDHMERAHRDMTRALGAPPEGRVNVVLLRNHEQYNKFAAGDEDRPATEFRGLSSLHHSYFADSWFDSEELTFLGAGVGYWDASSDAGNSWGVHSARHAASISVAEAADPSPKALASLQKRGRGKWDHQAFWEEKNFPTWYRFGLSSYAGRYFIDQFASEGKYHWAREWSVGNLNSAGGLRPLEDLFESELSLDNRQDSTKLLNEYGLVMAFVLDAKCEPVVAAYAAWKDAIRKNDAKELAKNLKALEGAILANEKALHEFAQN